MRYKNFVLIQVAPLLVFLAACIGEAGERIWGKYKPPGLPHTPAGGASLLHLHLFYERPAFALQEQNRQNSPCTYANV